MSTRTERPITVDRVAARLTTVLDGAETMIVSVLASPLLMVDRSGGW
jgi:hypothetical protein